jgi:hypothetical protein
VARKVWTAAEMESLSRDQQQAVFDESVVTDFNEVPTDFLDQIRADAERLIDPSHESQPLGNHGWLVVALGVSLVALIACSSTSKPSAQSAVVTCGNSATVHQDVDYAGTPTRETTPDDGITEFVSQAGKGLPAGGYEEVSASADPMAAPTSVSPEIGTAEPKFFVHRSAGSIDVGLTMTASAGAWHVDQASFCESSKS